MIFFVDAEVEKIFFLGDAVGYFPEPVSAIELLLSVQSFCVLGNHDAMLIERIQLDKRKDSIYQIEKSRGKIPCRYLQQMITWLPYLQLQIDSKKILMVHGSPWNPLNEYIYPDADLEHFTHLPFDIIFMGHTHRPFIRKSGDVMVVNAGSCGLPRDQGNLASCAIYNTKTGKCEIIRVPFDTEQIIKEYENHMHPDVIACLMRKNQKQIVGTIAKR